MASLTNNSNISEIGKECFSGCSLLEQFAIGNSTTKIGDNAFANSGLTSIIIPANVTTIGTTPFTGCSAMTEATVNCALVKGMFSGCSALKKVILGDDVTKIPDEFFKGTALEEFTISSSITDIGSGAFENCTKLTSITIPDNVTSVQPSAFAGCTGLTSVTYSGTPKVTDIYVGTFKNCSGLTSFTIPASVTEIWGSAFDGCTSLTTVNNNATLTSIGDDALRSTKITSLALAEGLTSIGNRTFANITTLTDLTIPSSVETIGAYAFSGCTGVSALNIPQSVKTIGNGAFADCVGLTTIALPATLTSVGEEAFSGCTAATELTIANGLTTIGKKAFNGCTGIKSVTIPASVTSIDQEAFNGCTALQWIDAREATSLTPGNTVRAWTQGFTGYDMFCGTPASCLIYLPKGYAQTDIAETYRDQVTNDVFTDASDNATCPDYQFDAAKAVVLPYGFTATKTTATRSFTAQQKSTVYLPFAIGETDAAGLGKFYEFDKVDGDVVSFKSATATEGGKAYLFEPASALTEIVANDVAVVATAADETTEGLKGVYEETVITDGLDKIYFWAAADGAFSNATSKLTVPPTRAYLQLASAPAAGARLMVSFDGEATGIATISRDGQMDIQTVYDLQGRRVNSPVRGGLYIVGGKKMVF
ncbi:MAG: leucine-rich repeat domain-containing protein [Prevotella sp.]|nr:leucine-rich repeat domain-containing protein [Prevotella sp.]